MAARVLVVEDDPVTTGLLTALLEGAGYDVTAAADGLTGARVLGADRPAVILLDVVLPDLDGWELCAMIRTLPDPDLSRTPILMLTSRASQTDRLRGLRLGADDYVTKPFDPEELVLRVERLAAKRHPHPAAEGGAAGKEAGATSYLDLQATLHHELKNHLVAIAGFARRLESKGCGLPEEQLRRYAGFIRRSSEYLGSFVENVLLTQKIEAHQLDARGEPVDLSEVVHHLVSLLRPLAEDKGVQLAAEVPEDVPAAWFTDHGARTCASNLLENAIKYTPEGGRVTAALTAEEGHVVLEVTDSGPGIPPEARELIFDRFYRAREAARTTKGTGLGLHIVKNLADSLGAAVAVDDAPGGGARFRLSIPVAGADGGEAKGA